MLNQNNKCIIFLYTRLADYFYQSILRFLSEKPEYRVTIIKYPTDKNAPFSFQETEQLKIFDKTIFNTANDIISYIEEVNSVAVYSAGWSDKDYMKVSKYFYNKLPTIVGLDNPWESTLKQNIGSIVSPFYLKNKYKYIWVAGKPQYEFAKKLGYSDSEIYFQLYVANTPIFNITYERELEVKKKKYPRKLIFIGRYVEYKQPLLLVQLFTELFKEGETNDWSLELIGSGPLEEELKKYESDYIKINSFIKPQELPNKLSKSGAFCLPSKSEHWGVVVHEAAATGLPLLLSNTTYAGSEFLVNNQNGFLFDEKNKSDFKLALKKLFMLSDEELFTMGLDSFRFSKKINADGWIKSLLNMIKSNA
jgi:glycosyltransferase involved in cell wall biosynthesis